MSSPILHLSKIYFGPGCTAGRSAVESLKSIQIMCLLLSGGKASLLQFLSSVVGPFSHHHIKDPGGYRVGEAKRGEKTPMHVLQGVEAERKLEPVSV